VWFVVGTLSVLGGFCLTSRVFQLLHLTGEWLPYAAHFIGALLAGAMMLSHAALRPSREPLAAGLAAVGILAILFLLLPNPMYGWVPTRSASPLPLALALAAVSVVGAVCGAVLARRFTTTSPHTLKIVVFSTLLATGMMMTFIHIVLGAGLEYSGNKPLTLATLALVILGGFVTQRMISVYRPWASGAGLALLATLTFANAGISEILLGVVGALIIGAIGARLARRWVVRPDTTPLPTARMQ